MKKFVKLEMFFVSGDVITIPIKHIKRFDVNGIKKDMYFSGDNPSNKILEGESAESIEISVLKEWLYNNRSDYIPDEQNMDIVKNLSYIERIKNYNNMAGVALRYNDGTERTIGITGNEDIITVKEDGNIVTIEIK